MRSRLSTRCAASGSALMVATRSPSRAAATAVITAPPPIVSTKLVVFSSSPFCGRCGRPTKTRSRNDSPTVSSSMLATGPYYNPRMLRVIPVAVVVCVLVAAALGAGPEPLAQDKGAAGTWQRLLKLQTTASVMHTTAHPDDEQGGMLAQLSRGRGARVSLLTLTRGESGDNAIGPELFDAVGLIRTEELLLADRYYGVDRQYFSTAVDYGFSKRLEEALVKWGRENVLRDIVRIIRIDRPLVLVARFQGNERDGHGNHQAAGLLTQDAYRVAGDPNVYPEQIRDGLRPWQPLKLYMGGVRENEDWTLRIDTNEYSPWLGDSYAGVARIGLSFQRSQNGGRVMPPAASSFAYYKRLAATGRLQPGTTVRLKP